MQPQKVYLAIIGAVVLMASLTALAPQAVQAQDMPAKTTETPAPAAPAEKTSYTVKSGDYLEEIADAHHVTWPSIYEVNQTIDNPDMIYPEQKLEIPATDVPLTRIVPQQSSLQIPANYNPQPVTTGAGAPASTVHPAPKSVTAQPAAPATPTAVGGVPGLSSVLGRPYVAGGTSPAAGFDCSGLTQYLAAQKGVSVPRTAAGQYAALRHISLAEAWPGDIVVFNLGHVGTYLGGGQVVHALNPAQGIRIENVQTAMRYNGFLTVGAVGH